MKRRMIITLITGALLGVFCIIGAQTRSVEVLIGWYLFAFWFNRLLMGFVFGLLKPSSDHFVLVARGIVIGLIVSFSFYAATVYFDLLGFLVGAFYGIVIEYVVYGIGELLPPLSKLEVGASCLH